jgi:hypothetical protein
MMPVAARTVTAACANPARAALRLDSADPTNPTVEALAGFEVELVKNDLERALDFAARSRAMAERGQQQPYRANALIHGAAAGAMLANVARGYQDGSLIPIEVIARKR